jgi:hypothetical protein
MKIRKFNEEVSHVDDETSERLGDFTNDLSDDIESMLSNLSGTLDDYTTNLSSQIKVDGFIDDENGTYEYVLTIKRIK